MKWTQRLRDGSTAVLVVVVLVFAAIGLFVGDAVRTVVRPGKSHTRIETVAVPGPTVTKTVVSSQPSAARTSAPQHVPAAPRALPEPTVTVTETNTRVEYRDHNVFVPGPTVTKTVSRLIPGPTQTIRIPLPAVTITIPVPGPTITIKVPLP